MRTKASLKLGKRKRTSGTKGKRDRTEKKKKKKWCNVVTHSCVWAEVRCRHRVGGLVIWHDIEPPGVNVYAGDNGRLIRKSCCSLSTRRSYTIARTYIHVRIWVVWKASSSSRSVYFSSDVKWVNNKQQNRLTSSINTGGRRLTCRSFLLLLVFLTNRTNCKHVSGFIRPTSFLHSVG